MGLAPNIWMAQKAAMWDYVCKDNIPGAATE
jgi:hypothetical protein